MLHWCAHKIVTTSKRQLHTHNPANDPISQIVNGLLKSELNRTLRNDMTTTDHRQISQVGPHHWHDIGSVCEVMSTPDCVVQIEELLSAIWCGTHKTSNTVKSDAARDTDRIQFEVLYHRANGDVEYVAIRAKEGQRISSNSPPRLNEIHLPITAANADRCGTMCHLTHFMSLTRLTIAGFHRHTSQAIDFMAGPSWIKQSVNCSTHGCRTADLIQTANGHQMAYDIAMSFDTGYAVAALEHNHTGRLVTNGNIISLESLNGNGPMDLGNALMRALCLCATHKGYMRFVPAAVQPRNGSTPCTTTN